MASRVITEVARSGATRQTRSDFALFAEIAAPMLAEKEFFIRDALIEPQLTRGATYRVRIGFDLGTGVMDMYVNGAPRALGVQRVQTDQARSRPTTCAVELLP